MNLPAVGYDESIIYFATSGAGTELDPFVSVYSLHEAEQLAQDSTLQQIVDLIPQFVFDSGKLQVQTGLAPLTLAQLEAAVIKVQEQQPLNFDGLASEYNQNILNSKIPDGLTTNDGKLQVNVTLPDTYTVTGTVDVGNFPNTEPLSLTSESGILTYRNTALSNTPQLIKSGVTSLRGWQITNTNTSAVYVNFYNHASPIVGTTPIVRQLPIPPSDGVSFALFFQETTLVSQEDFSTAMSVACVNAIADNTTTAPSTPIRFTARYK